MKTDPVMRDSHRDHDALQQYFGLPSTVGRLDLRLIHARALESSRRLPEGIVGEVRQTDGAFDVSFSDRCSLRVEPTDRRGSLCKATLTILACRDGEPFIVLIRLHLVTHRQPYFMIPGVMYGTNNASRGITNQHCDALGIGDETGYGGDPQLDYRGPGVAASKRLSPNWHFRADRSAVPMVYAHTGDHAVAIGVEEATAGAAGDWTYNSLGIWTDHDAGDAISIALGSLDWPGRVVRHQLGDKPVVEALDPSSAGRSADVFVSCQPSDDLFDYEPILENWHEHLHESPRPGPSPLEAIHAVAPPLIDDAIDPKSGYFCMFRDMEGIAPIGTLLAWAGILQIAEPLMRSYARIGHERYLRQVEAMVDRALTSSFNEAANMFFDVFEGRWQTNTWWPSLGHASVVNGHACWLIYLMNERGYARPGWMTLVRRVLRHVLESQREDGRLPSGFSSEAGKPTGYDGYGGCFFVAPLLMLAAEDRDQTVQASAEAALEHYWRQFTALEWMGVDLDCRGAVDSGSSYALIRALAVQHRRTRSDAVLKRLTHAFYYECTYRFGHNTRHRAGPCDWSSCGSRITSTHNVHLDAYGGLILEELAYLVKHSHNLYFQQRLEDAFAWARQAYNRENGEYGYGKKGWAVEQYYHTYDTYHHAQGDGAVWEAYFPWSAGAMLNAFLCELDYRGGQ